MARAARYAGRQAALIGLLGGVGIGIVGACASMQPPPGAPFDADAPVLLSASPDSGAVIANFDDNVEFQFDEVIGEQGLERLVAISPRHDELSVSWKRKRFTVKPRGGWYPNAVYQVTLRAGVTDLQNNRTEEGSTIVFSTGGDIPDTRIMGSVIDWEAGRMAAGAVVEVIRLPDSLTYIGEADSLGVFELLHVPTGTYLMRAGVDGNNNRRIDAREVYDSTTVTLSDSLMRDFWTFRHDTLGPRITNVSLADSQSVTIGFNQRLALETPDPSAFGVWELPDSARVGVSQVLLRAAFDSLRQAAADSATAAAADSATAAAADSALAAQADSLGIPIDSLRAPIDSVAARPDSVVVDTTQVGPPLPLDSRAGPAQPDSTPGDRLLAQRPALFAEIVIATAEPLKPGARYWIEASVANLLGAVLQSGRFLSIPAAAVPDST